MFQCNAPRRCGQPAGYCLPCTPSAGRISCRLYRSMSPCVSECPLLSHSKTSAAALFRCVSFGAGEVSAVCETPSCAIEGPAFAERLCINMAQACHACHCSVQCREAVELSLLFEALTRTLHTCIALQQCHAVSQACNFTPQCCILCLQCGNVRPRGHQSCAVCAQKCRQLSY